MAEVYCERILEDEQVLIPPEEIVADLARQGTLERLLTGARNG